MEKSVLDRRLQQMQAEGTRFRSSVDVGNDVTWEQLRARYDAVVVGSALHDRAWVPEAVVFLSRHAALLAGMPVWLFSVGMTAALARPLRRLAEREGPSAVAPLAALVRPRGTRLFSGVVSRRHFPPASRAALRLMGGRYGDFRDWADIDAWAAGIAADLTRAAALFDEVWYGGRPADASSYAVLVGVDERVSERRQAVP